MKVYILSKLIYQFCHRDAWINFFLLLALINQEYEHLFKKNAIPKPKCPYHKMKSCPQFNFLCLVAFKLCFLLPQMNHVWQRCCYRRGNKFLQVLWKWTAKKCRDLLTPPLGKERSRNGTSWGSESPDERLSNTPTWRQTAIPVGVYIGESLTKHGRFSFFFFLLGSAFDA